MDNRLTRILDAKRDHVAAAKAQAPLAAVEASAAGKVVKASAEAPPPANPDEADQSGLEIREEVVRADDARIAAWLAFTQALFASAEFRYVR